MAWELRGQFTDSQAPIAKYPSHLLVGNFLHYWKGEEQIGRYIECLICNVTSNTKNRNGDARFIRKHRQCGFIRG